MQECGIMTTKPRTLEFLQVFLPQMKFTQFFEYARLQNIRVIFGILLVLLLMA